MQVMVIIPVYKHEAYLMDAVQSIINQTYNNWKMIIICDDINLILDGYEKLDSRIKTVHSGDHRGKTKRLNEIIPEIEAEFIAFQDADDISIPQRLALSVGTIGKADIIYGDSIYCSPNNRQKYVKAPGEVGFGSLNLDYLKYNAPGNTGSIMIKTATAKKVPFDENVQYGEDWIWWIKLFKYGIQIKKIELPLYYYRNYTSNFELKAVNKFQTIFKKMYRYWLNYNLHKYVKQCL